MTRTDAARKIAADRYVKRGKFEIDPHSEVSVVPKGIWISAWVFVSTDEINDVLAEDIDR